MPRTILLDSDIVAWVASASGESRIDWDADGDYHRLANASADKATVTEQIRELKETLDADRVILCLSDPSRRYFRHSIYPQYKANRTHGQTPLTLNAVKSWLREGAGEFEAKWKPGLEADDVLGIFASHPSLIPGEKIVVTSDKDLRQIAGLNYNLRSKALTHITPFEADWFFYHQVLTGDPVDGFPGCRGIGPIRGRRILQDAEVEAIGRRDPNFPAYYWKWIVRAYIYKGQSEADALTQAQVARICRHTDYNFQTKEVIPWTPPSSQPTQRPASKSPSSPESLTTSPSPSLPSLT
jgi:DNA polymerase-1